MFARGDLQGHRTEAEMLPFVLSETLPIVPAKLVKNILKGEYVDMAKLLKDSMEAERRRCSSEAVSVLGHMSQTPWKWEIPYLMSCLQCYSAYTVIECSKYPEKAREMWAYL